MPGIRGAMWRSSAGGGEVRGGGGSRKIREIADMPIVFCTAYAEEPGLADQMLAVLHAALIAKPVSSVLLEQAFSRLFAGA